MNLTLVQEDALKEIINIGVGKAASMLGEMIEMKINLNVPYIKIIMINELGYELEKLSEDKLAYVKLDFRGSFSGTAMMVFPADSASKLVSVLTGEEEGSLDLDALRIGTLTEIGNIVINGVMGSIGNILNNQIDYALPEYLEGTGVNTINTIKVDIYATILLAETHFKIEQLDIEGNIILLFELSSFGELVKAIDRLTQE